MPEFLKRLIMIIPFLLTGCGDSLYGAYEASLQNEKEGSRVMGVAIIQRYRIIADGQTVKVLEWKVGGGTITALGDGGRRLVQFTKNEEGDLVQALDQSRVIYKKYEF